MTYKVFGGTLSLTQSINYLTNQGWEFCQIYNLGGDRDEVIRF